MARSYRDAILEGVKAAARLHKDLQVQRGLIASGGGAIDIFGTLLDLNAVLLFRPLENLLGAFIPSGDMHGVIISTQRQLRIQRFTGSHELGHIVMKHEAKIDGDEILGRDYRRGGYDLQEVSADAFAAEFLIPKWLIELHASKQKWNRDSVKNPIVVYQLALRVGASYSATCRALERDRIIDSRVRESLLSVSRKKIKQDILQGLEPASWYNDVWLLTEHDEGVHIEGQPEDCFVLRLKESGGAGYLWDFKEFQRAGFTVLRDQRESWNAPELVGGPVIRSLAAMHPGADRGAVSIELKRPWKNAKGAISQLHLIYDLYGKEVGMPRALRRKLMLAA